VRVWK